MKKIVKFVLQGVPFWTVPIFASVLYAADVQRPVVAGAFYPKDKAVLQSMVKKFINSAELPAIEGHITAIISPHAGYQYSGRTAGYAYKAIKDKAYKTAIIVAPSHSRYYPFKGLSVLNKDAYLTPLGEAAIDKELTQAFLSFDKKIKYYPEPFLEEHSAEVQIPFIQEALPGCRVVVILTGEASYDTCTLLRAALTKVVGDRKDIIIIASSDMSHFHPDRITRKMDRETLLKIEEFNAEELFLKLANGELELCGHAPVTGVMMAARNLGADTAKPLHYATSADVGGDTNSVVGYCAVVMYRGQKAEDRGQKSEVRGQKTEKTEEKNMEDLLTIQQKKRLIEIARTTIELYVKEGKVLELKESDPVLNEEMGAFVTLHSRGQLRGCIGNIIGRGPLYLTVQNMAIAAATEDPRFSPVKSAELKDIDLEISALSPLKRVKNADEIVMGKHGVIVQKGFASGVYLPQVATETGWTKEEFMNSLCAQKAGIPRDSWKNGTCTIDIFTAEVFGEKELK